MTDLIATASARQLARTAGGLYLANIVLGFFAIGFVPATIFVAGDASATAHNIQANEGLYRLGIVAHIRTAPAPGVHIIRHTGHQLCDHLRVFRALWPHVRVLDFPVDIPSPIHRCAALDRGVVLSHLQLRELHLTWVRRPSRAAHR